MMVECSSYHVGHNVHWIQWKRSYGADGPAIPGRARLVGEIIEFTADDGGPSIPLRNHDPRRVREILDGGRRCEYVHGCSLLRFENRPTMELNGEILNGTPCVSVARKELRPCFRT